MQSWKIRPGAVTTWSAIGAFGICFASAVQEAPTAPAIFGRHLASVDYGAWGVYGGGPAEKRCDSSLVSGPFACCWKNRMTSIIAEQEKTRYRWVCVSDTDVPDCQNATAPGNKSLHEEPHACKRHVHNYVEYNLEMKLYYVLYSSGDPIVLDDTIAANCSVGIRLGTARLLQVSPQSVEILAGPRLTTAVMQDGAMVQSVTSTLRLVPDYHLDRLYVAAVAEGNRTAYEEYNVTLRNIEAALSSKNALWNLSALHDNITVSLRERGAVLKHVNVEELNVTATERNSLGGVIRNSTTGEISQANRACAVVWLILLTGLSLVMQL